MTQVTTSGPSVREARGGSSTGGPSLSGVHRPLHVARSNRRSDPGALADAFTGRTGRPSPQVTREVRDTAAG